MSVFDTLKNIGDDAIEFAVYALDVIGDLAGSANSHNAADIIMVIRHVLGAVGKVGAKTITIDEARAELQKLLDGLAKNDATADHTLDKKFDRSDEDR